MIFGISRRALLFTSKFLPLQKIVQTPKAFFSRASKFNEFRAVLEHEIEAETKNTTDLSSY